LRWRASVHPIQIFQLHSQDRSLYCIQTKVASQDLVVISGAEIHDFSTSRRGPQVPRCLVITIPPSPNPPRFFEGKKAEAAHVLQTKPARLPWSSAPTCLCGVFNNRNLVHPADLKNPIHLRHLSVQVVPE
jgi:hypothetical protein